MVLLLPISTQTLFAPPEEINTAYSKSKQNDLFLVNKITVDVLNVTSVDLFQLRLN